MSEAAQNAGAVVVAVFIGLALLLRFVSSRGTMRRKDVERNTQAMLRQARQRRAARDVRAAVDQFLNDRQARTQGSNYRKGNTR